MYLSLFERALNWWGPSYHALQGFLNPAQIGRIVLAALAIGAVTYYVSSYADIALAAFAVTAILDGWRRMGQGL